MRPQILLFFSFGVLIGQNGPRSIVISWLWVLSLVAFDMVVSYAPLHLEIGASESASILHRATVAVFKWRLAIKIVRQGGLLKALILSAEKIVFLVFCSHMITISVLAMLFNAAQIKVTDPIYPVLLLLQLSVIFAVAKAMQAIGAVHAPVLLAVLTGKKLRGASRRIQVAVTASETTRKQ